MMLIEALPSSRDGRSGLNKQTPRRSIFTSASGKGQPEGHYYVR